MTWQPKQVKLDQKGMAKVLGEREAQVMDVVWKKKEASVRDVCGELCKKRDFSFNTIMTIMNRLTSKGLLTKRNKDGMFCYSAKMQKKDFMVKVASDILSSLFKDSQFFNKETVGEAVKGVPKDAQKVVVKASKGN